MVTDDLRALDAGIHRKVFGLHCETGAAYSGGPVDLITFCEWGTAYVPRYTTDIAAAWQVVEKLTEGEYVKVRVDASHYRGYFCCVTAADPSQRAPDALVKRDVFAEAAETAPLAIVKAALKAVNP